MSYKMMSPNTTIWWVPLAGLTTPAAPKATEVNAGTNISAAVVTGYTFGATDSETNKSKSIVDEGNVETPTVGNYEGKVQLFRDAIGTGTNDAPLPSTVYTQARNLFKSGRVQGWIVVRHGKKATATCAADDVVSVYKFTNDLIRDIDSEKNGPILTEVEFLPQGEYYLNKAAVA